MCLAHGIHLGVLDVLFKADLAVPVNATIEPDNLSDVDSNDGEPEISSVEDSDIEFSDDLGAPTDSNHQIHQFTENYKVREILQKVRKVVRMFKKSPVKNETLLQRRVLEEHGKELMLLLDTPTRWNSSLRMLERFLLLKKSISLALIDTECDISFESSEWEIITTLCCILKPIEIAANSLCATNSNLILADVVLSELLRTLEKMDNVLSVAMYNQMVIRIKERRSNLSHLAHFLHTGEINPKYLHHTLINPDVDVKRELISLHQRNLGGSKDVSIVNESDEEEFDLTKIEDFSQRINFIINNQVNKKITVAEESNGFEKEINSMQQNKTRGASLDRIYDSIMSVKPTSAEAERNFSVAGNIVNTLSTRLGDESILNLTMLKSHFAKRSM